MNRNPSAILDSSFVFPYYRGGGLDITFLGFGEMDRHGNVNVSKFNHIVPGCGGFIDITHKTKKLVFCGTFSAVGAEFEIGNGKLTILKEGQQPKIVDQVEQITLNGRMAYEHGQELLYITERCVFRYGEDGLELLEAAPGIDIEKDILDRLPFVVKADQVKRMPDDIFR